ncbi:cytochrome P450 [Obba rivulosa]|uniref:Cytochrome P450 n=1 Tax=Obba rivulosa TaxID=1052685 RepID=A0A8E2J4K1_9APHY|nr:cytochrome P450 [Obba rivulosa]
MMHIILLVACLLLVGWFWASRSNKRLPLPPGPTRWLLKKNELPWKQPWRLSTEWSKKFGPLTYLHVYGRDMLLVNDVQTATEMLEQKSLLYSRRPTWSMATLTGLHHNVAFMDYTERQQKSRALLQHILGPESQPQWRSLLEKETAKLIKSLLIRPTDCRHQIRWYLSSFISRFTYGTSITDTRLKVGEELGAQIHVALCPGRWAVDTFPFLIHFPAWLPGMGFKRRAREAREKFRHFAETPYNLAHKSIQSNSGERCMVTDVLREISTGKSRFDEPALISATNSIHIATVDTVRLCLLPLCAFLTALQTSAILLNFLLLMTIHQDVQAKAYAEILEMVGPCRLPTLDDQASLPYVNAVMKEVHRYNPAASMVTRSPVEDDTVHGYRVPRNSAVMFNLWAMAHDANVYTESDVFRPERYIPSPSNPIPDKDPRDFTFGFGKRICPGLNLANAQVYMVISQILSVFEIKPSVDLSGREEIPTPSYTCGIISTPEPFKCRLVARKGGLAQQLMLG